MWMAELSERSGVPVATVKYYLRSELLAPGEPVGATRTRYDQSHVRRLRLIRALIEVGKLSHDEVREVLAVVDDADTSPMEAIGAAHFKLSAPPAKSPSQDSRRRVAKLMAEREWAGDPDGSHGIALAAALDALAAADMPLSEPRMAMFAETCEQIAGSDVGTVGTREGVSAAEFAVIGTLLTEPVIIAMRRLAQASSAIRHRQ